MKILTRFLLTVIVVPVLSSCLSFSLFPLARSIKVKTSPEGAKVEIFDERELIDDFTTPGRFYLFRDRNLTMIISKPGYRTTTEDIRFRYSPVRTGVATVTGLGCLMMPTAVDFLTGALRVPEKQVFSITLEPLQEGEEEIQFDVQLQEDNSVLVSASEKDF
ncbi:MAG TPA: hypothetical protein DEA96_07895 [Leptospiraceae bacterium]|nr:hypothetical protein [Spirochaetaceae bacterium]HBS04869.1 hypothetical protein [Leptospiraceae bacterium]|tara:strand:+ start:5379 stop:5864 length:486 start_codon:yes stop_codon:yes gene_type:complete